PPDAASPPAASPAETAPAAAASGAAAAPAERTAAEAAPPQAATEAPPPVAGRPFAVGWIALLAWLIPGAGHMVLGRWGRGLAFLLLVLATLGVGVDLDGELWWFERAQPVTWLAAPACLGMGLPYGVLRWIAGYRGQLMAAGYEYGGAFLLTAGLMNLLLVLDALDVARGHKA
ncbi:MAG TPA: DUF6677 family protein, partial [Thermoanaerobaculia bacterium]|nr:DUF6677 family protein [Thermoanaerobaculia bacterium]